MHHCMRASCNSTTWHCNSMQRTESSLLLSLPELALVAVVKCLASEDKLSLASSCRLLATVVSGASEASVLNVTYKTRWEGLCKILATSTLTCKTMEIGGMVAPNDQPAKNNAVDVLLGHEAVPACSFRGITTLIIGRVHVPLPCLLPSNLVRLLPELEELCLQCTPEPYGKVEPIPYCSSLRKLKFNENYSISHQLPEQYHTVEDLQRQLPNIDSLELGTARNVPPGYEWLLETSYVFLQAWGRQLTALVLETDINPSKLEHCTRLQSLTWSTYPRSSITFLPSSLTNLQLLVSIEEKDLATILQLPKLRVLAVNSLKKKLQQDWSHQPCTWQELSIVRLRMVDLGNLPLHSLEGQGCLQVQRIELPDPLQPDSLADVMHAAQCVGIAGITVHGVDEWVCELWYDEPAPTGYDAAYTQLVEAACRVVQPFSSYTPSYFSLIHFPRAVTALIKWASPVLREVFFAEHEQTLPWLWQALQCCCSLERVEFEIERVRGCADIVSTHVRLAAEHFVAVTNMPIVLVVYSSYASALGQQAVNQVWNEAPKMLHSCVSLQECTWSDAAFQMVIKLIPVRCSTVTQQPNVRQQQHQTCTDVSV